MSKPKPTTIAHALIALAFIGLLLVLTDSISLAF